MSAQILTESVIRHTDPEVALLLDAEFERQSETICLIPSENYVSRAVLEAMGSVFTNKYSEGYPGKRYYEGQQVDRRLEPLAIERAKRLFGVGARECPALLRLAGEPRDLPRLPRAGRHGDGDGAADGRPPDPRLGRLGDRQVVPLGAVRRTARDRSRRPRRGPRAGATASGRS